MNYHQPEESESPAETTTSTSTSASLSTSTTSSSPPSIPTKQQQQQPLTSLDLLGAKTQATKGHRTTPTGAKLESLTTEILTQASLQQWNHPVIAKHVTADFIAEFDHSNGEKIDSFEAYIAHHRRLVAANGEYRFYPMNACAQIFEASGTGTVHVLLKVVGHPKDVVRESVVIFMWRRVEDEWQCYKHKVIRGMYWNV